MIDNLSYEEQIIYSSGVIKNKPIIITIKNDIRYRTKPNGTKSKVCKFKNNDCNEYICNNYAYKNGYCITHNNFDNKNSDKILKKDIIEYSKYQDKEKQKITTKIGDDSEIFILNIIQKFKEIESCFKIGQIYDKCDIKYKFYNEDFERGLQVKTLTQSSINIHAYIADGCRNYLDNTLIVMVTKDRTKFGLIFSHECPPSGRLGLTFNPKSVKNKYINNIFTDINTFSEKLFEHMKKSLIYKENLSKEHIKEKESLERLKIKCKENNLTFSQTNTGASIYDCIINNFKIQCKFTSVKDKNLYRCNLFKNGPRKNGGRTHVPYNSESDIDFVIIELETKDLEKYFYVIPKFEFVKRNIFSNDTEKGLHTIGIPPPKYKGESKYIWILDYLNKFDLLKI